MSFSEFEIKKYIFYSTVILLFLVLLIRFYRLQISEVSLYSEKSLENSVKMISQTPVRGNIYDRNGKLIVLYTLFQQKLIHRPLGQSRH
jgi:penicillin-binding protein 2